MSGWGDLLRRMARRIFLREHEFDFADGEDILLRDSVSMRSKFYGDHGPLILTDRRLAFRARDSRITGGKPRIDIPLSDIAAVSVQKKERGLSHVLANDRLTIALKDGKTYEFDTDFGETWQDRLREEIQKGGR